MASKQWAEEKRQLAFVSSGAQPFEQVLHAADDEKVYNTDADDEADQLEIDIEWEWNSQKRRKKEHRMQMEKWEKRIVISTWERRAALVKLADCLLTSERCTWFEEMAKLDNSHTD